MNQRYVNNPFNWDEHKAYVEEMPELTLLEKDQAKRAFDYLKETLGPDFLQQLHARQVATKQLHPITGYVVNYAPWTRRYLTRFADSLRALEGSTNIALVIKQLEEPDRFTHNALLLDAAAKLRTVGLQAAFEPTLPLGNNQKQPDARLTSTETNETIFLEVSILQDAREAIAARDAMNRLTFTVMGMPPGYRWSGRLFKTPAPAHLEEIISRLNDATKRATQDSSFITISEEGTVEIAFCPEGQKELLEEWCTAREIKTGVFQGPPYDENLIARLKRKIEREQRQLPADYPNVVLIRNTDLFFRIRDMRSVMSELEEEVFRYPHVPLVLVTGSHLTGLPAEVMQYGEHRYTRRTVDPMCVEDCLLFINRYSPVKLSATLLSKFLRVF